MNIKNKINTINFKTLSYLIIFSVTILLLVWVFQLSFISIFYERYQIKDIEKIGRNIQDTKAIDLITTLENIAYKNNICLELVNENDVSLSFNNRISGCLLAKGNIQVLNFKNEMVKSNKSSDAIKLINPDNNSKTLIYMVKVNDGYVFINAPLEDINTTSALLRGQLIYIVFLAIILAILIAYFLSRKITHPIVKMTNIARRISKGETNLRYSETGIREVDELVVTLNNAQGTIEKNENLRRDLMANVSHDLKTPLTMIKAYAEMVKDFSYKDKAKRNEHLDIIVKESDRLNILVNDILELSKMQADADTIELEIFNLTDEINEIVSRYQYIKETEDYKINVDILDKMFVKADKNKINQVIYNLLNNAINYTGANKTITIKTSQEKEYYLIEIIDTGKGIKPEEIDCIWDKYYKNDKNHKRNVVGTGLGLSIVKEILTKHNFPFGVNSVLKNGTIFYFKIKKEKYVNNK